MSSVITSALALIVTLGVLIAFHEFGHYWVARRLGVKVLRYSIGFGKPIWMRRRGADQTEYAIAAIPLGGYVKMLDEREGEVPEAELPRAFNRQSVGKRIAIVAAGPIFNLIFAVLAYFVMYSIGIPGVKPLIGEVQKDTPAYSAGFHSGDEIMAVDGQKTPTWSAARLALLDKSLDLSSVDIEVQNKELQRRVLHLDLSGLTAEQKQSDIVHNLGIETYRPPIAPVIGRLEAGGAAERDGLKVGDRIIAVDGKPINDWNDWVDVIREHPEKTMKTELERHGVTQVLSLTPKRVKTNEEEIGRIGAAPEIPKKPPEGYLTEVQYGPVEALTVSFAKTWQMSALTVRMIGEMIIGEVSVKNLSGPITIATYAGVSANLGLTAFLSFLAVVSISLGVLNLLPIPLLDGGHLLYYFIELVRGNPLSEEMQARLQQVGIVILGMLMIIAIYNDIYRLIGD
jgi:regulator of sigma E protease